MPERVRELIPVRHGILAIDDTGLPKQGTASVGVQRQYCGALGKIANCHVAVSTAWLADGLAWLTSMEWYLPQVVGGGRRPTHAGADSSFVGARMAARARRDDVHVPAVRTPPDARTALPGTRWATSWEPPSSPSVLMASLE
jgi:hypothetical protein